MLNVRPDARWDLVQATLEAYFRATPVVIGASLKRKHHFSENFKVRGFTPDYQPRRPKVRDVSRMSMKRYSYDVPRNEKIFERQGMPYFKTEWSAIMWVKHHKRLHKARRHGKTLSLFALDMAGVVCAPFPPGFLGDNPDTATGLLGKAAVGMLKLTSTAEEKANMAACAAERNRENLLYDPMGSFLRVRAVGAVRPAETEPGAWRTFNLGLLEVCHMARPAITYSPWAGAKALHYADRNSEQLPLKTYQIQFMNNWSVVAGGTEDTVFAPERLIHHNRWWHSDNAARRHSL